MKAAPLFISLLAMLSLSGCGKGNESGRSNLYGSGYGTCVSYSQTGVCTQYQNTTVGNYNSPYGIPGVVNLNQVQMENPCILSSPWGQVGAMQRSMVQVRVNLNTIVQANDIYIGVTSFGDVAALVGNGTRSPLFVAYLCPRQMSGQGILYPQILIGASTPSCRVKPITAANMAFPDGTQANFRWLEGGSSAGRPFSFCR